MHVPYPDEEAPFNITVGRSHACLAADYGVEDNDEHPEFGDLQAWCWGRNHSGRLGDNTRSDSGTPVQVSMTDHVNGINAGASFTCALRGAQWNICWVDGDPQEGSEEPSSRFVSHVTGSLTHGSMTTATGNAECWGSNGHGQLGDGTRDPAHGHVARVANLRATTSIATGPTRSCAIVCGIVQCWGDDATGQTGDVEPGDSLVPGDVQGLP